MSPKVNSDDKKNMFDQAGDFLQNKKEEATNKAEEIKGQVDDKANEVQKSAQDQWDKFNQSEADKKESGEKTLGEGIGEFINNAKDTTGKAINDTKAKLDETFSDKKN